MKYRSLFAIGMALYAIASGAVAKDPMAELAEYCFVREESTQLMARGRDRGVSKEAVLASLPSGESDAEAAAHSRLDDVYRFAQLDGRTLEAFRRASCIYQGMLGGVEPTFDDGIEASLLWCQQQPDTDRQSCVIRATKAALTSPLPREGRKQ